MHSGGLTQSQAWVQGLARCIGLTFQSQKTVVSKPNWFQAFFDTQVQLYMFSCAVVNTIAHCFGGMSCHTAYTWVLLYVHNGVHDRYDRYQLAVHSCAHARLPNTYEST